VIIDDFNIDRTRRTLGPMETNSPLVIDPNAVLPFPIPLQRPRLEGVAEAALACAYRMLHMLPPSLLVFLEGWELTDLPLRASPQFLHFIFKGSLIDPRLRASNEHILIVRVPRAGGRPDYPSHPSQAARCASKGIVPAATESSSPAEDSKCLSSKAAARTLVTKKSFRFLRPRLEGVTEVALDCVHRTSTFLSCAFCEQGGRLATPSPPF